MEVDIVEFVAGLPAADSPKKISGVHKRGWRYIPNSKSPESVPSVTKPTESAPAAEVQAAWCVSSIFWEDVVWSVILGCSFWVNWLYPPSL